MNIHKDRQHKYLKQTTLREIDKYCQAISKLGFQIRVNYRNDLERLFFRGYEICLKHKPTDKVVAIIADENLLNAMVASHKIAKQFKKIEKQSRQTNKPGRSESSKRRCEHG